MALLHQWILLNSSHSNQKLAIRIFKKGYSEKDGQQQLLRLVLYVMLVGFFYFKKEIKKNRPKCKGFEFSYSPFLRLINTASQGNWHLT